MSYEQDYFPPQKTKWKWGTKALKNSPWVCNLGQQYEAKEREKHPDFWLNPVSIILWVDQREGKFYWTADITDFTYGRTWINGVEKTALEACLAAEKAGYAKLKEFLPAWVKTAMINKWRPPCTPRPEWDDKTGWTTKTWSPKTGWTVKTQSKPVPKKKAKKKAA